MPPILSLKDIEKKYEMGETTVYALRGVSLDIEAGDFVAIMGPSGSGKSTLMHVLGLLDVPDTGSYRVQGKEAAKLSEDELAVLRRGVVGFIFQQFNLLPRVTAQENVSLPLLYSQKHHDFEKAKSLLELVKLGTRLEHRPNELSGGQQQRVAIARALVNNPEIILADEPTGNLDSTSEKEILAALEDLNRQGITVIIVTHEEDIGRHAKRLIRMRDGQVHSDERLAPLPLPPSRENTQSRETKKFQLTDIFEHVRQGVRTLGTNKVRTALSMLGILIGVAAVVTMLAIGAGAQRAIEAQLSSLGSNLLVLRPGSMNVGGVRQQGGATTRLTVEDATAIAQKVEGIKAVSPTVNSWAQITYHDKNWDTQIYGSGVSYAPMHAAVPQSGRFFTESENQSRSRVVVIGMTLVTQLFGGKSPIGEYVKINKVPFQVIGVLPAKGSSGFFDQDNMIVVPVLTAMHRLLGRVYVNYIDIEAVSAERSQEVQDSILKILYERHHVGASQADDAFEIRNMADIQEALSQSSKTMSLLLASIAAISLLVGGIGIMNIMLVSVTERTKEIGLRKAVGARRHDILLQFLTEAVVVSLIGGLLGIFLGWATTEALGAFLGWATSITLPSIFLSFFFSATIGMIFGIYPARQAAKLHPIDALRFE